MTGPYGITELRFWRDPEVKRPLRPFDKLVLNYLFSAPGSTMCGVYYCPPATIADETGVPVELVCRMLGEEGASDGASDAPSPWATPSLGSLTHWVTFDPETDEVFVHNLARKRIGKGLGAKDKRRPMMQAFVDKIQSRRLLMLFAQRYAEWGLVTVPPEDRTPGGESSKQPAEEKGHGKGHPMGDAKGHAPNREQRTENSSSPPRSVPSEPASRAIAAAEAADQAAPVPEPSGRSAPLAQIAGAVRKVWWAPDGKPPAGWLMERELSIWKPLLDAGVPAEECIAVIHGASYLQIAGGVYGRARFEPIDWLKRGEKLTGRLFKNTRSGAVPIWTLALEAYDRGPPTSAPKKHGAGRQESRKGPERLATLLPAGRGR